MQESTLVNNLSGGTQKLYIMPVQYFTKARSVLSLKTCLGQKINITGEGKSFITLTKVKFKQF
jgi:hypothetical protein